MALQRRTKDTVRQIGRSNVGNQAQLRERVHKWALAAAYIALLDGIPVYVGTLGSTNSITMKFYNDGDTCQLTLNGYDDMESLLPEAITDLTGRPCSIEMIKSIAAWLVETAPEAPDVPKLRYEAQDVPEAPQKPAQQAKR